MSLVEHGRFLRSEIGMVFRRRRNLAMLLVLAVIPLVIAIAVKIQNPHAAHRGSTGGALLGSITQNGVFLAFAALFLVLTLFLPLTVAVMAGDAIAGEASSGTLRYLLVVPVGRSRLLIVKYLGVLAWCVLAPVVVAISGISFGLALFPSGEVTLLSGTQTSLGAAIGRLALVVGYVAVMIVTVQQTEV